MTDTYATAELRVERIGATCAVTAERLRRSRRPKRLLAAALRLATYRLHRYAKHEDWTPIADIALHIHDDSPTGSKTAVADTRAIRLPDGWQLPNPIRIDRAGYTTVIRSITETTPPDYRRRLCRKCGEPIISQFMFGSDASGWEHMEGECSPHIGRPTSGRAVPA